MMQTTRQQPHPFDWTVRHAVYQHFASTGNAPSVAGLAEGLEQPKSEVEGALRRLADDHHALALAPGTSNIWMAWPFSAIPTHYPVDTPERTYWANCAWDALGIPALLKLDAATTYRCPDCAATLTLTIKDDTLAPTDAVVHFVVPPRRWYDNVGFT